MQQELDQLAKNLASGMSRRAVLWTALRAVAGGWVMGLLGGARSLWAQSCFSNCKAKCIGADGALDFNCFRNCVNSDPANCGRCGNMCPPGSTCVNGTCTSSTCTGCQACTADGKCHAACPDPCTTD